MNEAISQYIQQQLEAAKAKRQEQILANEAEEARKLAEKVSISSKNLLRVLSLMGIEAEQADLSVEGDFISFLIGNIRVWLLTKQGKEFEEGDDTYHQKLVHNIRFVVCLKHVLVDWEYSYAQEHEVWEHSEAGVMPSRLPDKHITDFFQTVLHLEETYAYLVTAKERKEKAATEPVSDPEPKFVYEGDTLQEILAAVMFDIYRERLAEEAEF